VQRDPHGEATRGDATNGDAEIGEFSGFVAVWLI
jgi:hypothetical protein